MLDTVIKRGPFRRNTQFSNELVQIAWVQLPRKKERTPSKREFRIGTALYTRYTSSDEPRGCRSKEKEATQWAAQLAAGSIYHLAVPRWNQIDSGRMPLIGVRTILNEQIQMRIGSRSQRMNARTQHSTLRYFFRNIIVRNMVSHFRTEQTRHVRSDEKPHNVAKSRGLSEQLENRWRGRLQIFVF